MNVHKKSRHHPSLRRQGNAPGPNGGPPPQGGSQDPNADAKNDLAQQKAQDKEQEALTKASNMEKQSHDTCMAIIANMK